MLAFSSSVWRCRRSRSRPISLQSAISGAVRHHHRARDTTPRSRGDCRATGHRSPRPDASRRARERDPAFLGRDFPLGGTLFALLRIDLIRPIVPLRLLVIAASWLAFLFARTVCGQMLYDCYLLGIVPPLFILAGLLLRWPAPSPRSARHGPVGVARPRRRNPVLGPASQAVRPRSVAGRSRARRPRPSMPSANSASEPDDRFWCSIAGWNTSRRRAPATDPVFPQDPTDVSVPDAVADPLGDALGANPRFVVSPTQLRRVCELPAGLKRAEDCLAVHCRLAATVQGESNSFTVYDRSISCGAARSGP